ncbi:MAG: hypothetical protein H0U75_01760 [Legionella sp.]|nr:hypothetical protein [Legionella sp.]
MFFKREEQTNFIYVGGEQFHALAVALIDKLKKPTSQHNELIKRIVDSYLLNNPKALTIQAYVTPTERMTMLINSTRMTQLVEGMAFVLRQIALDEIFAHPTLYPEVFIDVDPNTPKSTLRQQDIPLHSKALGALATALGIELTLSYTEHGKELRKLEIYELIAQKKEPGLKLALQIQNDQYFPKVINKTAFAYVGQKSNTLKLNALTNENKIEDTVKSCLDDIGLENKRLALAFNQTSKTLNSMVSAKEISKNDLVACFIKFLPQNSVTKPGEVYLANFKEQNKRPAKLTLTENHEHQEMGLLISSLSIWVSTGQVESDALFDHIDKHSTPNLRARL